MANVIDSLLVLLSLDPTDFKKGAQEANKSLKDTSEESTKRGKELEAKAKAAGAVLEKIRNQVIGLAALFTAGVGMKQFVSELTTADAAAGRTARNIGMSTETFTAWQAIAERAGGTAAGMAGSLQGLSQQFQQLYLTGQSGVVPYFRAVSVALADANGKARPFDQVLLDLSDRFSKMDPARAQAIGKGMGLDEGTINVLMQGRAAITALLAEQKKLGAANAQDAGAAAERQKQFNALGQAATDLGRKLLTSLTPAIISVVNGLTRVAEWFAQHPRTFAAFAGAIGVVAGLLSAALTLLTVKGFLSLIATMMKLPTAAAAAEAALASTAAGATAASASVGTGLLGMLGALAKSAALVATAGAIGYAIGSALYNAFIEDTPMADWIGRQITRMKAFLGSKEDERTLDTESDAAARAKLAEGKPKLSARTLQLIAPRGAPTASRAPDRDASSQRPVTPAAREQAQSDIAKLMAMGWTREQATGLAANIQRESGGNEKAVGDNGTAFGLAQWHPDRQREFFKQFGKDIRSATRDEQLQFINYELRSGNEQAAGRALMKTTTAAEAAAVGARQYERPADTEGEAARRAAIATSLYRPAPDLALRGGAATAMASNTSSSSVSTSTSHAETHIGKVEVMLPNATDAQSVAQGLGPAMRDSMSIAQQANFGLTS